MFCVLCSFIWILQSFFYILCNGILKWFLQHFLLTCAIELHSVRYLVRYWIELSIQLAHSYGFRIDGSVDHFLIFFISFHIQLSHSFCHGVNYRCFASKRFSDQHKSKMLIEESWLIIHLWFLEKEHLNCTGWMWKKRSDYHKTHPCLTIIISYIWMTFSLKNLTGWRFLCSHTFATAARNSV